MCLYLYIGRIKSRNRHPHRKVWVRIISCVMYRRGHSQNHCKERPAPWLCHADIFIFLSTGFRVVDWRGFCCLYPLLSQWLATGLITLWALIADLAAPSYPPVIGASLSHIGKSPNNLKSHPFKGNVFYEYGVRQVCARRYCFSCMAAIFLFPLSLLFIPVCQCSWAKIGCDDVLVDSMD